MPESRGKGFRKIYFILFIITLLCYLSVFISPLMVSWIGFFNYAIPIFLSIHFTLVIFFIFKKAFRKLVLWPIIAIVIGFYFIDITFSFSNSRPIAENDFSILSFNARYFRERRSYERFEPNTISWAVVESSDIKCFQEFSYNSLVANQDVYTLMKNAGYDSFVFSKYKDPNNRGLAIFSKFPIINQGVILFNSDPDYYHNNCIYADLVVKQDTIRVYNFHLKSMGLFLHEFKNPKKFSDKVTETIYKLSTESTKRALELDQILSSVNSCPYPYLIVGDLNELIYGNNYYRLRKVAQSSFEESGNGFGFTFNSIVFFIRLDHQFHSKDLVSHDLKVIRDIKTSDHFPVKGWYSLSE